VSRISKKLLIIAAFALSLTLAACEADEFYEPTATPVIEESDTSAETADSPQEPDGESMDEGTADESTGSQETDSDGSFDIFDGASEEDVITTDSGLQYILVEEGDGRLPESGDIVRVHYTGRLTDGEVFDSSVERGAPFTFPLGQGRVIRGWDEGIALLNEGASARLIIPPDLGYGEGGSGAIPPNSTLVFDVELLEILPGAPESPVEVDEDDYKVTDSGLKYFDFETGIGPTAGEAQIAFIHFTAWLEDGTNLGSTLEGGQPIPYTIGSGELFPGFEEGLSSMQLGGSRQMVFPPELAYGEAGTAGGQIPPNATLIFEVQVIDIQ
jgi:FKBP-type peptidyl-prolyl cis-trans isomerase